VQVGEDTPDPARIPSVSAADLPEALRSSMTADQRYVTVNVAGGTAVVDGVTVRMHPLNHSLQVGRTYLLFLSFYSERHQAGLFMGERSVLLLNESTGRFAPVNRSRFPRAMFEFSGRARRNIGSIVQKAKS
jgi:hypothetical protein